ncbi:hypothetical protein GOP47_0009145, partial [Adiantum capillus-veneris]
MKWASLPPIQRGDVAEVKFLQVTDNFGHEDPGEGSLLPSQGDTCTSSILVSSMCRAAPSLNGPKYLLLQSEIAESLADHKSDALADGGTRPFPALHSPHIAVNRRASGNHASVMSLLSKINVAFSVHTLDILDAYHEFLHLPADSPQVNEVEIPDPTRDEIFFTDLCHVMSLCSLRPRVKLKHELCNLRLQKCFLDLGDCYTNEYSCL